MPDAHAAVEAMAAALRPFGWTCGPEFWKRYHSDPWVFNLANAVVALTEQADRNDGIRAALAPPEATLTTPNADYVSRLEAAILDIDAHATGMGEDEHGFVSRGYIVTVGALHRALGVVGHTSPKCRLCSPDAHDCASALGALISAAYGWVDATDLVGRARAEDRLREAVQRVRGPAPTDGSGVER